MTSTTYTENRLVKMLGKEGRQKLAELKAGEWVKPIRSGKKGQKSRWQLNTNPYMPEPPGWASHLWAGEELDIPF
jgi:hypothetical protein